jgi:hypothetical protein
MSPFQVAQPKLCMHVSSPLRETYRTYLILTDLTSQQGTQA